MVKKIGIVVGIDTNGTEKAYRVLIATIEVLEDKQYNWKFECKMMTEDIVIQSFSNGAMWLNIELVDNKIKGSSGDLKRFDNKVHRPFVIISQINNSDGKIIGYKIANYDGSVKNIQVKKMIAYGNRITKLGGIPVQNAIFIPDEDGRSAHFKSYPSKPFIEEVIKIEKNQQADKRRINTVKNEKTLSKLEQIYTKEQIKQLKLGKEHGVEIKIYANPSLSAEQMKVLRKGLESKLNVRPFAFPNYTVEAMKYYEMELISGMDIRSYLNPEYSIAQIAELSIAVDEGLDVSKMSDPKLSVRQMQERRIRLENGVFHEEDVNIEGSWI